MFKKALVLIVSGQEDKKWSPKRLPLGQDYNRKVTLWQKLPALFRCLVLQQIASFYNLQHGLGMLGPQGREGEGQNLSRFGVFLGGGGYSLFTFDTGKSCFHKKLFLGGWRVKLPRPCRFSPRDHSQQQ